jgi:hypothetical protein
MGSPTNDRDAESHEKPKHRVRISPFFLGVTLVLQRKKESFKRSKTCLRNLGDPGRL